MTVLFPGSQTSGSVFPLFSWAPWLTHKGLSLLASFTWSASCNLLADKIDGSFNSLHFPCLLKHSIQAPKCNSVEQHNGVACKAGAKFWKTFQYRYLWASDKSINVCPRANLHFLKPEILWNT